MALRRLKIIGVMASHKPAVGQQGDLAAGLGRLIAQLGCDLLTGGGGAMEVVCEHFTRVVERAGCAIGIIPAEVSLLEGRYRRRAEYPNQYVEMPIYTHLDKSGEEGLLMRSRNHINALTSDAVVILEGGTGTLAEAYLAVRYGKPVIALLTDVGHLAELDRLPVRKTTQLEHVEAFIRDAVPSGPAPNFKFQAERPANLRQPDF